MRSQIFIEDFSHDDLEAVLIEEIHEPVQEPLGLLAQAVDTLMDTLNIGNTVTVDRDVEEPAVGINSTNLRNDGKTGLSSIYTV